MNELRIFENEEFGTVRTFVIDGKSWFVGNDVARALEYSRPRDAIANHCKGAVDYGVQTNGGIQKTKIIPEGDIYRLIIKAATQSNSDKVRDKAERFETWIFDEVIPSIRQNGGYLFGQEAMTDDELLEKALLVAQRKIAERDKMILEQNHKIQELSPKGVYFDAICDARILTNFRDAAKELGMSQTQFTGYLKSNGYVYATSKGELRPTEPYRASDLFQMKSYVNPHNGFSGIRTYLTPKGVQYFKLAFETKGLIPDALPKHGGRNRNAKR